MFFLYFSNNYKLQKNRSQERFGLLDEKLKMSFTK